MIGIGALVAVPMSARSFRGMQAKQQHKSEIHKKMEEVCKINAAAENGVWMPGKMEYFSWAGNEWIEEETQIVTYFENGLTKTMTQAGVLINYVYDELGRVSKMTGCMEDQPDEEVISYSITYDPVVKDAIVKMEVVMNVNGMAMTQTAGAEVTRNASGNVTEVATYEIPLMGSKEYESVMTIEYGDDGKANQIKTVYYEDGMADYSQTYYDIVWENTDGQILTTDMVEDNYESGLFWGANRLSSCKITDDEMPGVVFSAAAEYSPDGYILEMKLGNDIFSTLDYARVDDFGSYDCTEYSAEFDDYGTLVNEDGETEVMTYRVDSYGLVLEDKEHYVYDDPTKSPETYTIIGHVIYNTEHGYPEEYWSEEGYNDRPMHKEDRALYSEYEYFGSGIETVETSDTDEPVEYYNLQGVKVQNPSDGIYIMRQGATSKLIKK